METTDTHVSRAETLGILLLVVLSVLATPPVFTFYIGGPIYSQLVERFAPADAVSTMLDEAGQSLANAVREHKTVALLHCPSEKDVRALVDKIYLSPDSLALKTKTTFVQLVPGRFLVFLAYCLDKAETEETLAACDAVASDIAALVPPGTDPWTSALIVHDELTRRLTYAHANGLLPVDARAYRLDCLLTGQAVCSGYAKAYQYILTKLGIPCVVVSGSVDKGAHAWNAVSLNGVRYYVDVTWDDSESLTDSYRPRRYFMFSEGDPMCEGRIINQCSLE